MASTFHTEFNEKNTENPLVIADDFGMSRGINRAIIELAQNGYLHGASVMTTAEFYDEAISKLAEIRKNNDFKIGLHLDLTYGNSQSKRKIKFLTSQKKELRTRLCRLSKDKPNLAQDTEFLKKENLASKPEFKESEAMPTEVKIHDKINSNKHVFKNGFLLLFVLSFLRKKKLIRSVAYEIRAQIRELEEKIGHIDYIDGHQHIHFIPLIFQIVVRLANKQRVCRIRIIKESFFKSFDFKRLPSLAGIVKFLVLKFCFLVNRNIYKKNLKNPLAINLFKKAPYFYSILYSCMFDKKSLKNFLRIRKSGENFELMTHPGYSSFDCDDYKNREYRHISSSFRDMERETIIELFKNSNR